MQKVGKPKGAGFEAALGLLFAAFLFFGFLIVTKGLSIETLAKSSFVFFFFLISPLLNLNASVWMPLATITFFSVLFFQPRWFKTNRLRYVIAAEVLVWVTFGAWTTHKYIAV